MEEYETKNSNGVVSLCKKIQLENAFIHKMGQFSDTQWHIINVYAQFVSCLKHDACKCERVCKCESLNIISSNEHHQLHWFHIHTILFH